MDWTVFCHQGMNICREISYCKLQWGQRNLLWLVKSLKHQHDSRIKGAITSGERWDEGKRRKKGKLILDSMRAIGDGGWNLCKLNGSTFNFFSLLLLNVIPCIFIRKLQPLWSWWWISPAGLIWFELVFYSFHLYQYPHLHHGPVSLGRP